MKCFIDYIKNNFTIAILIAIICTLLLSNFYLFFKYDKDNIYSYSSTTPVTSTDIQTIVKKDIEEIKKETISNEQVSSISKDINKEIVNARNESSKPILETSSKKDSKEVKAAVSKNSPSIVIDEPSTKHDGTNVYAISIKRAQHGVGVYTGYKHGYAQNISKNATIGLHYRNKRIVYQIGIGRDKYVEGRIAYELFQW